MITLKQAFEARRVAVRLLTDARREQRAAEVSCARSANHPFNVGALQECRDGVATAELLHGATGTAYHFLCLQRETGAS